MRKLIKLLLKDNIFFIAISSAIIIGILSLIQVPESPIKISYFDKVYHAIAYFMLALTWLLSFPESRNKKNLKYAIAFGCVFYGIIIEVLQTTLVGVFLALLIFKSIYKKINAI